jgi:hypothetical protein
LEAAYPIAMAAAIIAAAAAAFPRGFEKNAPVGCCAECNGTMARAAFCTFSG